MLYNVGDIVFVNEYVYSNSQKGKNHLFVIIDSEENENNIAISIDYFGMLISSKINKSCECSKYKYNIPIKANDKNGLNADSIVKTDELYQIPNNHIIMKIGTVDSQDIEEYINCFKKRLSEALEHSETVS